MERERPDCTKVGYITRLGDAKGRHAIYQTLPNGHSSISCGESTLVHERNGSTVVSWPARDTCLICGESVKVEYSGEEEWCALGLGPLNADSCKENPAASYWQYASDWIDEDCASVEASDYDTATLVLERLDAHRLTLDYNGGHVDAEKDSEQWLFEGEYWDIETPQKDTVWVKRLD